MESLPLGSLVRCKYRPDTDFWVVIATTFNAYLLRSIPAIDLDEDMVYEVIVVDRENISEVLGTKHMKLGLHILKNDK